MKVRGRRECADCGERWSYYKTGEITCPSCGGMRSSGIDERRLHTDGVATFDLEPIRARLADGSIGDIASETSRLCRAYTTARGFVDSGRLLPLDETYLAATELRYAVEAHARSIGASRILEGEDEEYYLLSLLRGADEGDRPAPDEVPRAMWSARGLASAAAVEAYRRDLRRWLDDRDRVETTDLDGVLERVGDHRRRIEALDGEVEPAEGDRLVEVLRDLTRYLVDGEETALVRAEDRLDRLG